MAPDDISPPPSDELARASERRGDAIDYLVTLAETVNVARCTTLERLELLRQVEVQALAARRLLLEEARAAGFSWSEIAASRAIRADEAP